MVAVVIAKDLEAIGLAWMPTISYDTQAVLAGDKVRFHLQEVAFVVATDAYAAQDALQFIEVEYEVLPAIVNCRGALDPDAPVIRDDKVGQEDNIASPLWEAGDKANCDRVFADADMVVTRDIVHPRVHPCPMETCGMVADMNPATGQLNIYNGNQAPHAHRTVYAQVAGLAEQNIRILCNDIGGGFGNKVPVYPGYVCAIAASIITGAPVKWIENRAENLASSGFARDYVHRAAICAKDGRITGLRVNTVADHGAFDSTAQPTRFPAGFFHIVTGSYDLQGAYCQVKSVYTNKAPGGVAYRCSFRIAEAVYVVERMVDALAMKMRVDPVELRMRSFIRSDQFPYETATGWVYDSGDYHKAMKLAMRDRRLRRAASRAAGEARRRARSWASACAFFTEGVGAGPRRHMDILGLAMNDGAELRIHPSGQAVVSISAQTSGQGHETTFAQIVAEELGISPNDIVVRHGDTDKTPYGLGTYGSRSIPVSGGAVAVVSRKVRDKARQFAALMLETRAEDLAWEKGRWYVKGDPERGEPIESIAEFAYSAVDLPDGLEGGLDAQAVYDPPNLTYPFGAYISVVDIDPGTGKVDVRRFIAVDDCGVRINPMIVDGQITGGLAEGIGQALTQIISFDERGKCLNASLSEYLLPTALECPEHGFELGSTVTPCPHHPIGAKGVGESPGVRVGAVHRQRRRRRAVPRPRRHGHRHPLHASPRLGRHAEGRRAAERHVVGRYVGRRPWSIASGARTRSIAMIAAPMTPARSPSRQGTIRRSRVASASERLKIPSRTPAMSCACASAMSPPMTMTAGLKKFTVPARTSPSERPASRTMRMAVASPAWTRRTTSRLLAVSAPSAASRLASACPPATASRQPTFPHVQTTSSAVTRMWPMSPAAPRAPWWMCPAGDDAAADAGADLDEQQVLGVAPVGPVLAAGHDVHVVVDEHRRPS